ncbi:MAG: winged helix DNA-binding protein [Alphaproteobacteria bacterium]
MTANDFDLADPKSHFSTDERARYFEDLEYAFIRCLAAYQRWIEESHLSATGTTLGHQDIFVLHTIRLHEVPKTLSEISEFLNRKDLTNLSYSLRKLDKAGFIRRVPSTSGRQRRYEVTDEGEQVTNLAATLREKVLLPSYADRAQGNMPAVAEIEALMETYERATHVAVTHRTKLGRTR